MPRAKPTLLVLTLSVWLAGCHDVMMGTPLRPCATQGQQCDLGHGVLGVCFDIPCPEGQSPPCFTCTKQH